LGKGGKLSGERWGRPGDLDSRCTLIESLSRLLTRAGFFLPNLRKGGKLSGEWWGRPGDLDSRCTLIESLPAPHPSRIFFGPNFWKKEENYPENCGVDPEIQIDAP
jgi:hypothetical protein